ncbi:MAG: alpha-L-arabinofuranosidase [Verrucomicrobiia bacterium]
MTIFPNELVRNIPNGFFGINVNFLLDGEWAGEDADLAKLVGDLGAGILRYPGGEKSDATYFAPPPGFDRVSPTLIRASEWPRGDQTLYDQNSEQFVHRPLDFNDFMRLCRETGAQALLVLPYDIRFATPADGSEPPSFDELMAHARAWVRYAKENEFPVRAWEIGNESYLSSSYNGQATAADYAADVLQFAALIREIDPDAKIAVCGPPVGTNLGDRDRAEGSEDRWWEVVLREAGSVIDYFTIHTYPVYGWGGFEAYGQRETTLAAELASLESALHRWARAEDAARIRFLLTETNSADWSGYPDNAGWSNEASFGHGLVLFDILANAAMHPRMDAALVWNTRWVQNKTGPQIWDAVAADGSLLPTGVALQAAARYIQGSMLKVSTPQADVGAWAVRLNGDRIRVILINRHPGPRSLEVRGLSGRPKRLFFWAPGPDGPDGLGVINADASHGHATFELEGSALAVLEFLGE